MSVFDEKGPNTVTCLIIEIAHRQVRCKKILGFGWYYERIKQRKGPGVAAVATARKLLAVVGRILKDNRPFEVIPPRLEVPKADAAHRYGAGQEAHRNFIVSC